LNYVILAVLLEQIGEQLENIIELIKKSMTGPALSFYEREFDFFHQITDISRIIKLVLFCLCLVAVILLLLPFYGHYTGQAALDGTPS